MSLQNIEIKRITITSANTEKVVSLPATRVFSLRVQAESASVALRMAFEPGVVSSGGANFWRIPAGGAFESDELRLTSPRLYLSLVTSFTTKVVNVMSIT